MILRSAIVSVAVLSLACGDGGKTGRQAPDAAAHRPPVATIRGAGATFPQPVYSKWSLRYFEKTAVKVAYQPSGSRAGMSAVRDGTVDFGSSDMPMSPEELDAHELCQFPVVVGAVVPVVNLPGFAAGELKLSGEDLAGIYLGEVTRWNDEAIADDNPGAALPDEEIVPVYQSDLSGTGYILNQYLSKASERWRTALGETGQPQWSVGVGAKDNPQVAKFVKQFKYTIGYVEYSLAKQSGLAWVSMRNQAGHYAIPNRTAFEIAAKRGQWGASKDMRLTFADLPDEHCWPIIGASYVLVRRKQDSARHWQAMLGFFQWALTDGARYAEGLEYVTVPQSYVQHIADAWREQVNVAGAPAAAGSATPLSPGATDAGPVDATPTATPLMTTPSAQPEPSAASSTTPPDSP